MVHNFSQVSERSEGVRLLPTAQRSILCLSSRHSTEDVSGQVYDVMCDVTGSLARVNRHAEYATRMIKDLTKLSVIGGKLICKVHSSDYKGMRVDDQVIYEVVQVLITSYCIKNENISLSSFF